MRPLFYHTRRRYGFTLVELLVVILILAILLSVALPLYTASIADASKKAARTNMATIATAVAAFRVRDPNHGFPAKIADLVGTPTSPGDLSNLPNGPGPRTYVLLGIAGNSESSCWTPSIDSSNNVNQVSQPIPTGSFAVASSMDGGQTHSGMNGTDDGCYIPGVSVE